MEEVSSFLVTKHSWKGKYKRVFSIGALSITTYNPSTMEATNTWQYRWPPGSSHLTCNTHHLSPATVHLSPVTCHVPPVTWPNLHRSDFITILPAARGQASQPNNEFIITFKKVSVLPPATCNFSPVTCCLQGKKTDSMRFSSDHRAAIITETMR